jgi:tmRNA-binding protein
VKVDVGLAKGKQYDKRATVKERGVEPRATG